VNFADSIWAPAVCPCDHENELLVYTKAWNVLSSWVTVSFTRMILLLYVGCYPRHVVAPL
jgi:hypothetical protein